MKIPENLWEHVKTEVEKLRYGKITIEIQESGNKIDVVTENRERFLKEPEPIGKNYHKG